MSTSSSNRRFGELCLPPPYRQQMASLKPGGSFTFFQLPSPNLYRKLICCGTSLCTHAHPCVLARLADDHAVQKPTASTQQARRFIECSSPHHTETALAANSWQVESAGGGIGADACTSYHPRGRRSASVPSRASPMGPSQRR